MPDVRPRRCFAAAQPDTPPLSLALLQLRYVLMSGHTDQQEDIDAMVEFCCDKKSMQAVEVLPYHLLGVEVRHHWVAGLCRRAAVLWLPCRCIVTTWDACQRRARARQRERQQAGQGPPAALAPTPSAARPVPRSLACRRSGPPRARSTR